LFEALDDDSSKELDFEELFQFVGMMNPRFTNKEVHSILEVIVDSLDRDNDGSVSEMEFVDFIKRTTAQMNDQRFNENIMFWTNLRQKKAKMDQIIAESGISPLVTLEHQAKKWWLERSSHSDQYVHHASGIPPPLYKPEIDLKGGGT